MKTLTRCVLLALALLLIATTAVTRTHAAVQPEDEDLAKMLELMRSETNPYKIRTLNQVLQLTGPEAETFWPVYQRYEEELAQLGNEGLALIRDFLELQASGSRDQKDGCDWNWVRRKEEIITE